jgi:hypothetical protein
MFETTDEEVFKRAKKVADSIMKYIKETHEGNPAISILHALAIIYIHYYREILLKGTEDDVNHARISLKSLTDMIGEYEGETEYA